VAWAGIDPLAILAATVVSSAAGAAWYTAFARPWLIALGKTRGELMRPDGRPSPVPFVVAFLAQLLMAVVLAGLVARIGPGGGTMGEGAVAGLFAWLGFVVTTLATNHGFGGQRPMLTVIDGGHWLAVLVLQGAIIGLLGR
jgi:hypothetical protein